MLPSRCARCGAVSRDFLCASCLDFLVADRPLWLNPGLLPGPSLMDLTRANDVAIVAADLSEIEWRRPTREPTAAEAVRLVRLLHLDSDETAIVSVGDAEVLHSFLRDARRSTPTNVEERRALAAVCRYLQSRDWMPSHLAAEYGLRAKVLEPPKGTASKPVAVRQEVSEPPTPIEPPLPEVSVEPDVPEAPPESAFEDLEDLDLPEEDVPLLEAQPVPPDPIPRPEPPLPLPQPEPAPGPVPEPEPEPGPEPEEGFPDLTHRAELEESRRTLQKERADAEAYVQSRTQEFLSKEERLFARERAVASKEEEIEARARTATERLVALEKDSARREVLRVLGAIPGMSTAQADVIATAFPDIASLTAADEKALTQCKGVTGALAHAIRLELAPGELEDERRSSRLREEAQAFIEEGEYDAALECYDRLLRSRPEETSVWFDRAELLVLLDRPEEALQCYTRILDFDPGNRQASYERANLLFGLGRLSVAVDALRDALRLEPSKSREVVQKAEQLRRDGHPNEAVLLFRAILEIAPDDPRAILGLGDTLIDLGDSDAAEAQFARALGRDPQNAPILFRKGALLERKGRWGAAVQYYNRAIALRWNYPEPWLAKGDILLNHARPREALESFEKVASFDPQRIEAWAGAARAHAALGQADEAEAALANGARFGADHPAVLVAREAIAQITGARPAASEPLEPITDLPSLAKAFEAIEEEVEAPESSVPPDFQSFVESIEPEKEDTHVLLQLAELAIEGGDPQMGLLRYEQAIEREPRNADAWTGKGVALQQLERFREALEAYDRALSLKPNHELARKWRESCARHVPSEANE